MKPLSNLTGFELTRLEILEEQFRLSDDEVALLVKSLNNAGVKTRLISILTGVKQEALVGLGMTTKSRLQTAQKRSIWFLWCAVFQPDLLNELWEIITWGRNRAMTETELQKLCNNCEKLSLQK